MFRPSPLAGLWFACLLGPLLLRAEEPPAASVEELARRAKPSTVVITVAGREGGQQGMGTGFVVSPDGLIATNLHVIGEARAFQVQTLDGKTLPVTAVHASDRVLDLAIVKVEAKGLPALELADSAKARQGQRVVVLGNPLGLKHSVVSGVLSGTREFDGRKMLQLAIPIEPGNSGGPVLDEEGRVLGVVTMKSAVTENLGFAVESNHLQALLDKPNSIALPRWLTIGALDERHWTPLFGARWQQRGGRILVGGEGQGFGGRSLCLAKDKPPEPPYEVGVAVKLGDEGGAAGLVFCADGGDRHYGFYPSNRRLRLSRFEGPDVFSWKVLAEVPSDHYRPGEWNYLKVRVEKDKLQCFVNDQLVVESADRSLGEGRVGLAKFRQTEAEFKRFAVAQELPRALPAADKLAALNGLIDKAPRLEALLAGDLAELARSPAPSADQLRARSRELRARAAELERIAGDVYVQGVVAELAKAAGPEARPVDLFRAALWIARLDEEDFEVDDYIREVERMAAEIRKSLPEKADDAARLAALKTYLFEENGFHGSRQDYYNRANSYLNRVIDDREGLPITLAVLYLELARRLEAPVVGVGLPGHFVVRHEPVQGEPQLIDVYEGAAPLTRDDADQMVRRFTDAPLRDEHLKTAEPREILLRMLQNLVGVAQQKPDREAMLRYVEAALALDPSLVRERGMRAVLRYETGRRAAAIADLDWFLEHKPPGIELDQIRAMQEHFRTSKPEP